MYLPLHSKISHFFVTKMFKQALVRKTECPFGSSIKIISLLRVCRNKTIKTIKIPA